MQTNNSIWLLGSAAKLLLLAIIAALISAQWKHEAVPFTAFGVILILTVIKSRWVVVYFMGLRDLRPRLSMALVGWSAFFAVAAGTKALLATYGS
ncbi:MULTISPECIES: cytochrome C oxidase subunit IV family protein [unclassified Ensifer]|uniref:cytochrome C oxidase subunit IV family protein n=1 Tax=Ensifer TaxID=106591 RepID=UPI00070CFE61|nr:MULTISPECIES: cytochrome C oxidase subunit IV family protein [unclassified Ensifer]KQW60511.1 hypothetical protein ASD02_25270 [Ensifer sp. Root1252]KQW72532.1 hypothetical protein ASD03_31105 [Ensifer sp. Root127]KRC79341.1 hypothetical protein ASE32_25810 [Ensifer sp. Root231]KRC99733.1 hypothetical protein ASE47_26170 [Ensifer sp. Root258]